MNYGKFIHLKMKFGIKKKIRISNLLKSISSVYQINLKPKKMGQQKQSIRATFKVDDYTGNILISQQDGQSKEFEKMSDAVNYCKENNVMAYPQEEDESILACMIRIKALSMDVLHA